MKGMDVQQLLREAEKMQKQIASQQAELDEMTVEGSVGGGAVRVTANGNGKILRVHIQKEAFDSNDMTLVEDMVLSAIHLAVEKADQVSGKHMKKVTGGVLPFKSVKR